MTWKWSDAGRLKDGKPFSETDSAGNVNYLSIKGSFEWRKNVTPDYIWFNGTANHYLLGDTISEVPVKMNTLYGDHDDKNSKIIPVKIHYGDQIYDKEHKTLIQPKLFASKKGDSAYWKDFDWHLAASAGMERIGLPYSGNYGFVETAMYWPVNHMVAPKEQSVSCIECHTRTNGRLEELTGFYLPGRDYNKWLDRLGVLFILAALTGVIIHSLIRFVIAVRNKEVEEDIIEFD
jgi:hypothetical protein